MKHAIVIAADENYLPAACCVAISCRGAGRFAGSIFLMVSGAREESVAVADRFLADRRAGVQVVRFDQDLSAYRTDHWITPAAYARLYIDEVVPADFDRVLYLDSDLRVLIPLERLFAVNLWGMPMAGAEDILAHNLPPDGIANLLGSPDARYFNSGVMLFDWQQTRSGQWMQRARTFAREHPELCNWWDQDALNATFQNDRARIDLRWNATYLVEDNLKRGTSAFIRHFAGATGKAWRLDRRVRYIPDGWWYRRMLSKSPWPNFAQPVSARDVLRWVRWRYWEPREYPTFRLIDAVTDVVKVDPADVAALSGKARGKLAPRRIAISAIRLVRNAVLDGLYRPRVTGRDPADLGVEAREVSLGGDLPCDVLRMPDARILTSLTHLKRSVIVSVKGEVIPRASVQPRRPGLPPRPLAEHRLLQRGRIGRPPRRIRGTVVSLLGEWDDASNYFHWMVDVLPRHRLAKEAGFAKDVQAYLVPDDALPYQQATLDILGIERRARIAARHAFHLRADAVVATGFPREDLKKVPNWMIEWLRESFLPHASGRRLGRLVYVSRGDTVRRRLLNEDECLAAVLRPMGFEAYRLAELPFADQVRLFSGADVVVGVHGAGLTNLAFCRAGTRVLELAAACWHLPVFESIANERNLNYRAIVSEDFDASDHKLSAHFAVKPKDLDRELRWVMA